MTTEIWPHNATLPPLIFEPQPYRPLPAGISRWRLTLHSRQFDATVTLADTLVAELVTARSRSLSHEINKPAELRFTLDGRDPAALLVQEFTSEVVAWRYDEVTDTEIPVGRFVIDQSQDTLSEQADTTNFVGHTYDQMLARRYLTQRIRYGLPDPSVDQDAIVNNLVGIAKSVSTSGGPGSFRWEETPPPGQFVANPGVVNFGTGSFLPLDVVPVFPDGTPGRGPSGQLRDRTYLGNQQLLEALTNLGEVIGGYDWDVIPGAQIGTNNDRLRLFYPRQGVLRDWPALVYGAGGPGGVNALSRSVNANTYSNYVRVTGNNEDTAEDAPQVFAEAWDSDASNVGVVPTGLWMTADAAADVTQQPTLNAAAQGKLTDTMAVVPSYSLTLAPGAYTWGNPAMGDELRLVVRAGRLQVDTEVRVVSLGFDISDDGAETVQLGVGRPSISVAEMFRTLGRSLNALTRR